MTTGQVAAPSTASDGNVGALQKIVAVIPAFNEERFIGSVVLKARKSAEVVVVVDDGSSDATAEIAEAAGAVVVRHECNAGKGAALNTGFRLAREFEPDAVVSLDGDGQHSPGEMVAVVGPVLRGEADIVVGSRYLVGKTETPRHRVAGHWGVTFLTNVASGVPLTDSQSGFRAFSRRAVDALTFRSASFSVESEMQFLVREQGLRIAEVPVTITYRDKPKRNVILHGMIVLNGILRLIGQHRPLLFFGVPGFLALVAGLLWGLWVVEIFRASGQLAIGYALLSILFVLMGVTAMMTGLILHSVRALLMELKSAIISRA